jgi:ribosomal protein S18 acetylase RimI-like enzyme
MMKEVVIENLRYSEIDEVATILADSFRTNPAYSLIFKQHDRQHEGLIWLFKTSLILDNEKQLLTRVIKEKDTGKIIGTYTIIPPEGVKNSPFVYLKIGLAEFIFRFGFKTFIRMLNLNDINKQSLSKAIDAPAYYYLSMVVIGEEYRGTGIGSYVIKHAITELHMSQPACRLIGLTTQLPENVTFYSRLGFEKLDEGYITFKNDRYYNYNLKLHFQTT